MAINDMNYRQYLKSRTFLYFEPIWIIGGFLRKAFRKNGEHNSVHSLSVFTASVIDRIPTEFDLLNNANDLKLIAPSNANFTNLINVLSSSQLVYLRQEVCNG